MEKETIKWLVIPVIFVILMAFPIVRVNDGVEFTGEIIDKYDTYFVIRNGTDVVRERVDLDVYYAHDIGDIVTVDYTRGIFSIWEFLSFVIGFVGVILSIVMIKNLDCKYWDLRYERENSK